MAATNTTQTSQQWPGILHKANSSLGKRKSQPYGSGGERESPLLKAKHTQMARMSEIEELRFLEAVLGEK